MSKLRYKCWTKATDQESSDPRHSVAWVVSRRGWFSVFDDRLECGDWIIPSSTIQEAVLFEARQLFIPVFILKISTADTTYQFGFNPWCRVAQHLPFKVEHRRIKLGYSKFSIAVRVVLILFVSLWLWQLRTSKKLDSEPNPNESSLLRFSSTTKMVIRGCHHLDFKPLLCLDYSPFPGVLGRALYRLSHQAPEVN
ncbi:MAG: hypothetical protein AAGG51_30225 [Cyanobacteria bacterium P01_G01_bin.54]